MSVTIGWGIELPQHVEQIDFIDPDLLDVTLARYRGEITRTFAVFANSTAKTFYGAGVHQHYNPPLPTAQEVLALRDLQDRIGYDAELKPLMVVSLV